jgi:hypothetical protein
MPEDASRLADQLEIGELCARYNRSVDDGDGPAFAAVFTPDGALVAASGRGDEPDAEDPAVFQGAVELEKVPTRRPLGAMVHITADAIVDIDVDGDEATHWCTLILFVREPETGSVAVVTGRYIDKLLRTPDGWRFTRRSVVLDRANQGLMSLGSP